MYPMVSTEMMAGAVEMICFVCTAFVAIMSYMFSLRV